jgi:hypothetical protein
MLEILSFCFIPQAGKPKMSAVQMEIVLSLRNSDLAYTGETVGEAGNCIFSWNLPWGKKSLIKPA